MAGTTSEGQPMVRFVDVQKSYDGETLVVKNLNLEIAKGEFVTKAKRARNFAFPVLQSHRRC
jgi:hypothetical protein